MDGDVREAYLSALDQSDDTTDEEPGGKDDIESGEGNKVGDDELLPGSLTSRGDLSLSLFQFCENFRRDHTGDG